MGRLRGFSGIVVRQSEFLLASLFNAEYFLGVTGCPIQVIRMCCAVGIAISLGLHWGLSVGAEPFREVGYRRRMATAIFILSLLAILSVGWLMTDQIGGMTEEHERGELMVLAAAVAESLPGDAIARLKGDESDLQRPEYVQLKEALGRIVLLDPMIHYAYLMGIKDGQVFFYADAGRPNAPGNIESPPGEPYNEASEGLIEALKTGKPLWEGPFPDRWGVWDSALIPVRRPGASKPLGILGIDVDDDVWTDAVSFARLAPIGVTLLIGLLTALSFVARQRVRGSEERAYLSLRWKDALLQSSPLGIAVVGPGRLHHDEG